MLKNLLVTISIWLIIAWDSSGDDKKDLPRVLILGDSIYRQPASEISKELKGIVEVVYHPVEPGKVHNSTTLRENLDGFLGDKNWDLIYFNCGLGDLIYRAPGLQSFRVLPKSSGGIRATSAELYEKNIRQLAERLKKTEAKLIWASTTPIRHSTSEVFEMKSEIEYNQIAASIMTEQDIPILDMYQYIYDLIDMKKPASHGADPFSFEKKPIHPPVVKAIRKALL